MKSWCYLAQVIINKQITWLNYCVQHVICVQKFWQIGGQGIGKILGINTQAEAAEKEYKYIETGFLITLCYFINTSPSSISDLVCYQAVNNILSGMDVIQSGINLQWISALCIHHHFQLENIVNCSVF